MSAKYFFAEYTPYPNSDYYPEKALGVVSRNPTFSKDHLSFAKQLFERMILADDPLKFLPIGKYPEVFKSILFEELYKMQCRDLSADWLDDNSEAEKAELAKHNLEIYEKYNKNELPQRLEELIQLFLDKEKIVEYLKDERGVYNLLIKIFKIFGTVYETEEDSVSIIDILAENYV